MMFDEVKTRAPRNFDRLQNPKVWFTFLKTTTVTRSSAFLVYMIKNSERKCWRVKGTELKLTELQYGAAI